MTEEFEPQAEAFDRFLAGDGAAVPALEPLDHALRSHATPAELADQHTVVSLMSEAIVVLPISPIRGHIMRNKLKTRAAALSFAGTLIFGGAAYAATASGALDPILGTDTDAPADTTTTFGDTTTTTAAAPSPTTTDSEPTTSTAVSTDTTIGEVTTTTGLDGDGHECGAVKNHGDYVSDVAHGNEGQTNHGDSVSEAARSDCGKSDNDNPDNDKPDNDKPDNDKPDNDRDRGTGNSDGRQDQGRRNDKHDGDKSSNDNHGQGNDNKND